MTSDRGPLEAASNSTQVVLYTCDIPGDGYRTYQEQATALREIAASRRWVVERVHRDTAPGRVQRSRMLSRASGSGISAIIAIGLPYLSASFSDFLDFMHEVTLHDVRLVLLEDELDTASKAGKKLVASLDLVRQVEATFRASHARAGVQAARAAGRTLGRPPKDPKRKMKATAMLAKGVGVTETARRLQMPVSEVSRIKSAQAADGAD